MELPSFEELRRLAEEDPQALEALRQQHVDAMITAAPEDLQRRLRGLQFRIDAERNRASNPLSACLRISRMMHEHLHQLLDAVHESYEPTATPTVVQSASIIPFPLLANS
ncbi:DUF3135 domain-containing protein [Thalassolituus sp. LLYu03]|uniref:DUF3135 domain-containing protein n=1 Tax=Thalassolituus sp. LLYu03 TaxID=3421656 RepID=UPI003D2C5385